MCLCSPPSPIDLLTLSTCTFCCAPQENRKFTTEQVVWLTKKFMSGVNGGERIRDKKAAKLMKIDFANRLGGDGKPPWLSQSQIRGWFSRKAAALKREALSRSSRGAGRVGVGGARR